MRLDGLLVLSMAALPAPARAQEPALPDSLEARIWLDRGEEPVVHRGDAVRIFYRTSGDAHAAIFRIDTDGRVELLFPQDPSVDTRVRGGRDYRLLFPRSPIWRVSEDPGAGYFFMIASPEPLDLSGLTYDAPYGWDLSAVGDVVYEDPYVAIDNYVAYLIPDWDRVPYALDFITYNVDGTHTYPRFLCYDCHDFQRYSAWNPYSYACSTYRVVIWDDPYFYPSYRYSGTRVVVAQFRGRPRYAVRPRAPGDPWRPLVLTREAPPRRGAEYKEPAGARGAQPERRGAVARSTSAATPTAPGDVAGRPRATAGTERGARTGGDARIAPIRRATPEGQERPAQAVPPRAGVRAPTRPEAAQERPRPTLQRRPSGRLPIRRPPAVSAPGAEARPDRSARPSPSGSARPIAPARPGEWSAPTRGGVRQQPTRGGRPSAGSGAARPPRASARPPSNARPPSSARPPDASGGRPRASGRRPAGARPTLRPSTARPTVQPRRPPPRRPPPPPRRRPGG